MLRVKYSRCVTLFIIVLACCTICLILSVVVVTGDLDGLLQQFEKGKQQETRSKAVVKMSIFCCKIFACLVYYLCNNTGISKLEHSEFHVYMRSAH